MTDTPITPEPTDEALRAIAKRGRDSYSLATDNGWSQRESDLAAYQAVFNAGRSQALEEAGEFTALDGVVWHGDAGVNVAAEPWSLNTMKLTDWLRARAAAIQTGKQG